MKADVLDSVMFQQSRLPGRISMPSASLTPQSALHDLPLVGREALLFFPDLLDRQMLSFVVVGGTIGVATVREQTLTMSFAHPLMRECFGAVRHTHGSPFSVTRCGQPCRVIVGSIASPFEEICELWKMVVPNGHYFDVRHAPTM